MTNVSSTRHGFKGSVIDEYDCNLRGTFFKWCFLLIFLLVLASLWTFTLGSWFGPWVYDQVDRVTDFKFGFRDLRPEAVN